MDSFVIGTHCKYIQRINVIFLMWDTWKNCKPGLQFFHVSHIREITLIRCNSAVIPMSFSYMYLQCIETASLLSVFVESLQFYWDCTNWNSSWQDLYTIFDSSTTQHSNQLTSFVNWITVNQLYISIISPSSFSSFFVKNSAHM